MNRKMAILGIVVCSMFLVAAMVSITPVLASPSDHRHPDQFTKDRGGQGGTYANTAADDGVYHSLGAAKVNRISWVADGWYRIEATSLSVSIIKQISVTINAKRGSGTCTLIEQWYNFTSSQWVDVGSWALTTSDANYVATKTSSLTHYFDANRNMRVRIWDNEEWSFTFYFDYVVAEYTIVDQFTYPNDALDCIGNYKSGSIANLLSDDNTYYQRYYNMSKYYDEGDTGVIGETYFNAGYWLDSNPNWYIETQDGYYTRNAVATFRSIVLVIIGYLPEAASSYHSFDISWRFKVVTTTSGGDTAFHIGAHNWSDYISNYRNLYDGTWTNNTWVTGTYRVTGSDVQDFLTDNSTGYGDYRLYLGIDPYMDRIEIDQCNLVAFHNYQYLSYVSYRYYAPYPGANGLKLKMHFDNVAGISGYTVYYTVYEYYPASFVWGGSVGSNSALDLGETSLSVPITEGDPKYVAVNLWFCNINPNLVPYFQLDQLSTRWTY